MKNTMAQIQEGSIFLGIEFGSTRIKSVLLDRDNTILAQGEFAWENQWQDNLWTYRQEQIWTGLKNCYHDLKQNVKEKYGVKIQKIQAMGISAMMHGYLAFDAAGELLVPFRTWRNTNTQEAADILTKAFQFPVPLRWSVAHLYQAVLNQEKHLDSIEYMTTLAGYVHWKLTGKKLLGIGDASGMFPVDSRTKQYDQEKMGIFQRLLQEKGRNELSECLDVLFPQIDVAGETAGVLTKEGAHLLDEEGDLEPGSLFCPPEGDAGTGMVATNSVAPRTGNVSAGTSIFAMVVLEHELQELHSEIDMVTTPAGDAVAMVHGNNCTSDINAWVGLFREFSVLIGTEISDQALYSKLFEKALEGQSDCGGLMGYNYISGEPLTNIETGYPLFIRKADSKFSLANFMRLHLYSAVAALKIGMDILTQKEQVTIDTMYGHGGYFKTQGVGQYIMSSALNTPISVMETAAEGGAWGIAVLALFAWKKMHQKEVPDTLAQYLQQDVFRQQVLHTLMAEKKDVEGFHAFSKKYRQCIALEKAAEICLNFDRNE